MTALPPLRVLYLTPGVFDKGGISRYDRYQIRALRELLRADNVRAVSLLGPPQGAAALESDFAVDWHGTGNGASPREKLAYIAAALRLARDWRPTLIWCGLINHGLAARLAAGLSGARLVTQLYGREVWTRRPFRPDIRWALRRSDHVVSDCHFTARYVTEQRYYTRRPIEVIWDCVDVERFVAAPPDRAVLERYGLPHPDGHFNILTLGRLSRIAAYKGYERLLEVFPRLPAHARLIYAGGGDLIPVLRSRAETLGVAGRVIFTGFIDEADLPAVYRAASVFSLIGDRGPARGEGIPLTPLEAAACGVPILVGNQDGSREAAEDNPGGLALDPFDLDEIARQLNALAADEPRRQAMGRAARERVEREHAYPVFKERMRRFLSSLALPAARKPQPS